MATEFENKRILITGATGLIGKALVQRLIGLNARVTVVVRDEKKARSLWGDGVSVCVCEDIRSFSVKEQEIDYIIHAAAPTSSKAFVEEPADVIQTNILGTMQLLEMAAVNHVKGFVYLSSMEVYGTPETDEKITEEHGTNLNTMSLRSSYPESKRACESLCEAYYSQYGVPAKVVRLTQTFGPGVKYDDGRVFAEFARCVIENRDIILHTKGETKRSYLYTSDAVDAILTVLLKGQNGEAYNAANEETYCSIYEMAEMVVSKCANDEIKVIIEEYDKPEISKKGFAPTLRMNLDTSKLQGLGWKPTVGLEGMFVALIDDMKKGNR